MRIWRREKKKKTKQKIRNLESNRKKGKKRWKEMIEEVKKGKWRKRPRKSKGKCDFGE